MTCIVAVVEQAIIYFGGDSISVKDYNKILNRDSKIFQRNGILIGTCGSVRMRNLLQYRLEIPEYAGGDPMEFLVNDFVVAVRECFKKNGFVQEERGREMFDGRILLGFEHDLYVVGCEFDIGRFAEPYCAIGIGEEYAYGSLFSTSQLGLQPFQRLKMALQAAERHNTDVSGPFTYLASEEHPDGE